MTESHLTLRINEEGALSMEGQDFGELPRMFFGDDEYEYFVTVPRDQKDKLLLQLVRDRFMSQPMASSTFMKYLKEHNVPYEFSHW